MRAIGFSSFGGPEVLQTLDVATPEPTGPQIRIAVRAASVNPADWKMRSGGFGPQKFPAICGFEAAGVVDAVGPDAAWQIGDEVFGGVTGGYADYALCDAPVRKPAGLSWVDAASIPMAVTTANRVLTMLELKPGETLVVNGASGAVGSMAVQLATSNGVTVIGTSSAANQDMVALLGAIAIVYGDNAGKTIRALAPDGQIDAVFDAAGHGFLPTAIDLRGGVTDRIVTIADPAAADLGITFSSGGGPRPTDLMAQVAQLLVEGEYRLPGPAREFPLSQAAAAQRESEFGRGTGKIVLVTT